MNQTTHVTDLAEGSGWTAILDIDAHATPFGTDDVRRARPWERVHRKAVLAVKKRRPPWRRWVKHSQWIGRGVIDRALRRTPDPHRWGRPLFTNRQWYQQGYRLIGKESA